mgnify:FL=1
MEKTFAEGMIAKKPSEKAPDFIKANISIKTAEFITFLNNHTKADGWINLDVKEGKSGKWYVELNEWKKSENVKEVFEGIPDEVEINHVNF